MSAISDIRVAAGALLDGAGRVLIGKRPDGAHQGGLWEFPGGKLEVGETPIHALGRELREELGIEVVRCRPLIQVRHDYGDRCVTLEVFLVDRYRGEPRGMEGQPLAWKHPADMDERRFPAADRPIITALRLPNLYAITGADAALSDLFLTGFERRLNDGLRLVQLRAHSLTDADYGLLAREMASRCGAVGARLILNRDPDVAEMLPGQGLHLRSKQLLRLTQRPITDKALVGASCHSARELQHAESLGLDYVMLSPVLPTATHPQAEAMGWKRFGELVARTNLPVYALGGVGERDLVKAFAHGAQGVAGIRGFWV